MSNGTPGLKRALTTSDAVVIGLGSMIGAGVFASVGPAAAVAGGALLYGLLVAGSIAFCNAMSSAALAAVYPASGGTYVYGRERLGAFWGSLAGWAFIVGKLASLAVMALTFGRYLAPGAPRVVGIAAVGALTAVNYRGISKTAALAKAIVVLVVSTLIAIVATALLGGEPRLDRISDDLVDPSPLGILRSAGLLFFAFAGYARIATMGEEVRDPARAIPRAIPIALAITLGIYASVFAAALLTVGPDRLARSAAPLATVFAVGDLAAFEPVARIGAAVATVGVLLSLIAGVSRTIYAMASNRELPSSLGEVHPRFRVPHRAEIAVGATVSILVAVTDLTSVIGFSSFAILVYYAIANASAWTLPRDRLLWPRWLSGVGLVGCLGLALTLPVGAVLAGSAAVALGAAYLLAGSR